MELARGRELSERSAQRQHRAEAPDYLVHLRYQLPLFLPGLLSATAGLRDSVLRRRFRHHSEAPKSTGSTLDPAVLPFPLSSSGTTTLGSLQRPTDASAPPANAIRPYGPSAKLG
eukprot:CAMPEP_0196223420 /NCGR_PEP_ID=MMETSP0912-20130531/46679_1 /TAXON_ID=49265 /ORGANISM="Thalassiosira rotula, Strain GSO102" /LENGTH=114 /DNA_ID=CAMNT_0041502479 /DNA_START=415 /DNA_END=755 /DNA_ORIENTATION=-